MARDTPPGNPRSLRRCLTGGIGSAWQGMERWAARLHRWARVREAEVDAIGFSPKRALLLEARVPFHLAFRGACRIWIAMEPEGRTKRRQAAVAACAAWDFAEAACLRRDPSLRLGWRLLADLADVAAWSAACGRAYPVVPIVGVPLITETALRYHWAAAPIVLAHLAAVGCARRLAHKPLQPTNLAHQVLALLFGLGLRRVERTGAERVGATFEAERRAAETAAVIAGQYKVARSTYPVDGEPLNPHDVLSGIRLHFVSAREQPSALHDLTWGGRKGTLEALATEQAVQLDTALRAWKRDMNRRRSTLSSQVLDPTVAQGDGMTLLSGAQVARLGRALEALDLRGTVMVRVLEATRPGARVVLEVNGVRLVLSTDPPGLVMVRADPTPVAILEGGVLWALLEATDAADAVPLWSVVPGMVAFGGLAIWSRKALRERGEAAYPSMLSLSSLAALTQAIVVHAAIRGEPDRPDGTQRTPMQTALNASAVLAGLCWPSLDARSRRRTVVHFAVLGTIGVALLQPPRWRRDLIRNSFWLPALFVPSLAYAVAGYREVQRARAELHLRQAQQADAAARRGEQAEWERIRLACTEALASIDCVSSLARPAVERRLRALHHLAEERLHAA